MLPESSLGGAIRQGRAARGLIHTNHGVMLLAAAPILNGTGGGQPAGMVIWGGCWSRRK